MITKEQHGNCSKEAANNDCEPQGAIRGNSNIMNGFDPGGKDGSATNNQQISERNIPTDNSQDVNISTTKIHSELVPYGEDEPKGEKTKQGANDCIELSVIPNVDVGNGSPLQNTQSSSQTPPNSSVIQIVQEPQQISSEHGNGATPGTIMVQNPVNPALINDPVPSIQSPKSPPKGDKNRYFSRLPLLFERAGTSYFNPRFDSRVLEEQYWKSTFPRTTRRFQIGLIYLLVLTLCLSIYFPAVQTPSWPVFLGLTVGTVSIVACMLGNWFILNITF